MIVMNEMTYLIKQWSGNLTWYRSIRVSNPFQLHVMVTIMLLAGMLSVFNFMRTT